MNERFFLRCILAGVLIVLYVVDDAAAKPDTASVTAAAELSPHPIYDSGAWADPIMDPHIYWIDNNRVLFKTIKDNDKSRIRNGPFNLSVWDIVTNKVTAYTEYTKAIGICYSEGHVYYTLEDDNNKQRRFAGEFGKERPYRFPTGKDVIYNDMSCRAYNDPLLMEKRKTRAIRLLLDRHGYLDFGPKNKPPRVHKEPFKLFRPRDKQGIELSIPSLHIDRILYYEFKNAYMVYSHEAGRRLWWLYPDGKLEEVKSSYGMGYPVRNGLVAGRGKPKSDYDPGTVGLYFWSDNQYIKLIPGYVNKIAVSPDGCKLAFVHYPYLMGTSIEDPAPITLKAINLCVKEKTNGN